MCLNLCFFYAFYFLKTGAQKKKKIKFSRAKRFSGHCDFFQRTSGHGVSSITRSVREQNKYDASICFSGVFR